MRRTLIVGCGNMGTAILKSLIKSGLFGEIYIIDPSFNDENKKKSKKDEINFSEISNCFLVLHSSDKEILKLSEDYFDFILLAVKPQICADVIINFKKFKTAIFYSIMASKKIKFLENILSKDVKIVRCMPNLCASIKKSSSLICYNKNLNKTDIGFVEKITKSFGYFHLVSEQFFEEVTIISGCVPAFFALFCESLKNSLSDKIDKNLAMKILKESLGSTGDILTDSKQDFKHFISSICSPGGLTQVGVDVFTKPFDKLAKVARRKILKRSRELAVNKFNPK